MPENTQPFFSIITPTFKRPELLKRAIDSVRRQTFDDYEHIIVDDANDGETRKIVDSFNDRKIIFHQHSEPKGAAGGYNSGIRLSNGNYMLFLDDDDEYMPSFLETVFEEFVQSDKNENTVFIWTGVSIVNDKNSGDTEMFSKIWPSVFKNKEAGLVAATTIGNGYGLCVKRECIETIGTYDESISIGQDADFLFRLVRNYDFRTISRALVKIHVHNNPQLTDDINNRIRLEMREKILCRNMDLLNRFPHLYLVHFRHIADLSYRLALKKKGREIIFGLMKRFPFRISVYADFLTYELFGKDFFTAFYIRKLKRSFLSLRINKSRLESRSS